MDDEIDLPPDAVQAVEALRETREAAAAALASLAEEQTKRLAIEAALAEAWETYRQKDAVHKELKEQYREARVDRQNAKLAVD
jgi:hypothetical protein